MDLRETIAAVSTPPGAGGIGLVRLSGVRALPIARAIFTPRRAADPLPPRRLILGTIRDPATGALLDEVLFSYLPPPRTYTREPLVEINAHSGPLVLKKILELLIAGGARLAEPGEFTLRAFLNGRIDLTRAEAVIELIQAQSDQALLQANRLLRGELQERSTALRDALVALLAQLEAAIDFPEEELDILSPEGWIGELERTVLSPLDQLIRAHEEGRIYREGVSLVIVGKPNVGKSSLLNRLLREERALVTPVPGTTRDTIEETLHLRGFPFRIVDTAGIHRSPDAVEQAGIARARQKIETAHLILFMIDRSQPLEEKDLDLYREIRGKPHWLILNKIDLPAALPDSEVDRCFPDIFRLPLSARTGQGVESLKNSAGDWFLRDHPPESAPALVPTLRQKSTLEAARKALGQARDEMERGVSAEFVALFVQQALDELGALVGLDRAANEDVLEQIFSRFCIGK